MGSPTTNYGWNKPTIGADTDAWGAELNTDLDGIDSTVFSVSGVANTANTTANAALPKAGGTLTGALVGTTATFSGAAQAATPIATDNSTNLATTAFSRSMLAARPLTTPTLTDPGGTTAVNPGVMCGYGSAMTITPQISGRVLVMLGGTITNNVVNGGAVFSIRYGAGTAPAAGAAATGTVAPPSITSYANTLPAGAQVPLTVVRVVTGLTLGTPYWFDLSYSVGGTASGTANIYNSQGTVAEL